jgi:hypothetical protein
MNQDVQELVSCIKKVLVYYKLYVKGMQITNQPFTPPAIWDSIKEKINVEITTEEQVQEILVLTEELLMLETYHEQPEDMPQPFEISSALDNLKSAYSKLKGE